MALVLGFSVSPLGADPMYAPLTAALMDQKEASLAVADEAQILVEGYQEFLSEPDTDPKEKMAMRKALIEQRAKAKWERSQAARVQGAIQSLGGLGKDVTVTRESLKEAYEGVGELADKGRKAWEDILERRQTYTDDLKLEYGKKVMEAEAELQALETREKAEKLLGDAMNSRRSKSSKEEFQLALKLPLLKSAVEHGFGITPDPDDKVQQAQSMLISLVGYSQFFWDQFGGSGEVTSDRTRNIFGVPDGQVLTSDAIADSDSNLYHLSAEAKEKFNRRVESIWGSEGVVSVKRWNQKHDRAFREASEGLRGRKDDKLMVNRDLVKMLKEIDSLIEAQEVAAQKLKDVHQSYSAKLEEAKRFGDQVSLSSMYYNAGIWAKESDQLITDYAVAESLLENQLKGSTRDNWKPNPKGITESVQAIKKARKRYYAVQKVKRELRGMLGEEETPVVNEPEERELSKPTLKDLAPVYPEFPEIEDEGPNPEQ